MDNGTVGYKPVMLCVVPVKSTENELLSHPTICQCSKPQILSERLAVAPYADVVRLAYCPLCYGPHARYRGTVVRKSTGEHAVWCALAKHQGRWSTQAVGEGLEGKGSLS